MLKIASRALCAALLCHAAYALSADVYPSRVIKLVVPYPAGGSTDVTARVIADSLRPELGRAAVIDNKPGAGANIGADFVAKSAPDGYTLLMATSTHATNMSLYKSLPYDFVRDLAPVTQTAFIPNLLVVNPQVPATTLAAFIKYVKGGAKVNYGSAGNGSSQHLSGALFNSMVGGEMVHVAYKGGAPATTDVVAGQIQAVFAPLVEVIAFVKAGKLNALGITTKKRSPVLPDVPTIGEVLPGYEIALWNGVLAPAGTPAEVVNKLNAAIVKVLKQPDVRKRLAEQGSDPVGNSPTEFRQFIGTEVEKWKTLVKLSGAQAE
ncbi:MAG TPA: tripartite tricarboxylate transporter substrate binding protein [Burkholderiales bacterium]|nr:tripartite tricarboxylate transporter substrate binding protein [Burkholderiales bacterium]